MPKSFKNLEYEDLLLVSRIVWHRDQLFTCASSQTTITLTYLMEVDECPAPKQSYSDSFLLVKPDRPVTQLYEYVLVDLEP